MAGSKKGEFVILGAKKVHYGNEKPKFTFITGEKKSWPRGPFMRKYVQISSDEGYITSSPYRAIERGRRQHLKQTTSAP